MAAADSIPWLGVTTDSEAKTSKPANLGGRAIIFLCKIWKYLTLETLKLIYWSKVVLNKVYKVTNYILEL